MIPCCRTDMTACDSVDLLAEAHTATPAQRALVEDELVRRYLPMTRRMASRFAGRGSDTDDLLQVAQLALVKSMRGFDADLGCFEAYAKANISGALKRHLRDQAWAIRPPRRVQELVAQVSQSTAELLQQNGNAPTPAALAHLLGADVTAITEALSARGCYTASSLDEPQGQAGRSLSERLSTGTDPYDEVVTRLTVDRLCDDLVDADLQLLHLRFDECLTQREIAAEMGVSQMQVSRLLSRLMTHLRERSLGIKVA